VLENIFHTPDALNNGFNLHLMEFKQMRGGGTDGDGKLLWYGEECVGLMTLVLAG
jgi:hypothetical protein